MDEGTASRPFENSLALTILEVEEHLPPAIAAKQMDLLDEWLRNWLGAARLPTEVDMRRYWQWKMERNGRPLGWFDPIKGPAKSAPAIDLL